MSLAQDSERALRRPKWLSLPQPSFSKERVEGPQEALLQGRMDPGLNLHLVSWLPLSSPGLWE